MTDSDSAVSRRSVLRASAAAGTAAAGTGAFAGGASAQDGSLDEWLSEVSNYDGVVDETGSDAVTVEVGVEANDGPYGYGPSAVRVDPGTEVTFEWVSNTHNVVVENQPEDADWSGEEDISNEGYAHSHTFETEGVYQYFCQPHRGMGMKGAVVVGDVDVGGGSGGGGGSIGWGEVGVLGFAGVLGLGLLYPLAARAMRDTKPGTQDR